jgi:hypothetical protein
MSENSATDIPSRFAGKVPNHFTFQKDRTITVADNVQCVVEEEDQTCTFMFYRKRFTPKASEDNKILQLDTVEVEAFLDVRVPLGTAFLIGKWLQAVYQQKPRLQPFIHFGPTLLGETNGKNEDRL